MAGKKRNIWLISEFSTTTLTTGKSGVNIYTTNADLRERGREARKV